MDKFTSFVLEHETDDPAALVLQRERWPDIDVSLAVHTIEGRRRMRSKAPSWHARPELIYPSRLCVEQCSSEAACRIKTGILRESIVGDHADAVDVDAFGNAGGNEAAVGTWLRIADLTGGLGMDSYAFSKISEKVLYVEKDGVLAEASRHNFAALGCSNITVLNAEVTPEGLRETSPAGENAGSMSDSWEAVRKFSPDIIYLDPARRGASGQKVFRLEDCAPNILQLRDILFTLAPIVMVKLSPMADIDMVLRQLGPRCRRLDVISVDNECKELLVTMEQSYSGDCKIVIDCGGVTSFTFSRSEESAAVPLLYNSREGLTGRILLEPDKSLMKAGPFRLLSTRLGLTKLDVSTHYYICDPSNDISDGIFRKFRILRVEPLNNRTLKYLGKEFPQAEVTARNIPLSSDELRRRLESNPHRGSKANRDDGRETTKADSREAFGTEDRHASNAVHIFGLRAAGAPLLLVTERLS